MKEKNEAAKGVVSNRDKEVQQKLEQLREEHKALYDKKIATERDRENLEEQLKALRDKAEKEYGTSDIDQLRDLLEKRRQENERMVEEYRKHIDEIKQRLEEVEKKGSDGGSK